MNGVFVILVFTIAFNSVTNVSTANKKKLVIDNDAGVDDAMAIFLALLNEEHFNGPQIVALTTVNGNTDEDRVQLNNQRILSIAKRQDVPIYRGSNNSLVHTPPVTDYFGVDGLGDANLTYTSLIPPKDTNAVVALIELSKKYKGDLSVVTLGPVTNLALAIILDPLFLSRIDRLYVAAGHIQGDMFREPEFNAETDAEAYYVISQNAKSSKVTVFPYSQTQMYLNISKEWRNEVLGAIDSDIIRALNQFEVIPMSYPGDSWYALDPAMVAMIFRPDLVKETKYFKNSIELCGKDRGLNTNEETENPEEANVSLIYSVDKEAYMQYLIDAFSKK